MLRGVMGPPARPRRGEQASPFPVELFREALALLTRKPEVSLAPPPAGAHAAGRSQPHLTPTSAQKSHSTSRPPSPPLECGCQPCPAGLGGWAGQL